MRAVVAPEPGGPEVLEIVERPDPAPVPGEVLIDVAASAINRADLLQRAGQYPPPEGASDVLGLELAGTVAQLGDGVEAATIGDRVAAVVAGGGNASRAVVPASTLLPVSDHLSLIEAASIPEVFTTAWDNLIARGALAPGETALVHGGTSGVGTAAVQLASRQGSRAIVTGSSAAKLEAAAALGAWAGIDYTNEDFVERARELTDGDGVDVVLDLMGGSYLDRNLRTLTYEGRLVVIGLMGGPRAELDLGRMLRRRLTVRAATLRARPTKAKAALAEQLRREVLPGFDDGSLRPVIDRVLPLDDVAAAHRAMETGDHIGKIVLQVDEHAN